MGQLISTPKGMVSFPDDMSRDDIQSALDKEFAPPKTKEEIGPFKAGLIGSTADVMTAGAKGADVLGFPETAKDWLEGAEARRKKVAEQYHPKVPSYEDIYKNGDYLGSLGRLGQYAYEGIAESLPQMAGLAGAGLAGAAGAAALGAPAAAAGAAGLGVRALAGLGTAAAADVIPFTGSNIKAQMETGKSLRETSLPTAMGAAVPQALLDVALAEVLPGIGRAAQGRLLTRAAKKGLEGATIEGVSEGLQQAIEVGQADPEKLFKMGPDVQKELLEAAIKGGLMGGTVGAVGGAAQKRKLGEPYGPPEPYGPRRPEEPYGPPEPYGPRGPWEPTYDPNGTGLPGAREEPIPFQPDTSVMFPENTDAPYAPYGTGLPQPVTAGPQPRPFRPDSSVMFPEENWMPGGAPLQPGQYPTPAAQPQQADLWHHPVPDTGEWQPGGVGALTAQVQEAKQAMPALANVSPSMRAKLGGKQVYDDVRQQLEATGMPRMEANANATIMRSFYERMGTRLGRDPFELYSERGVQIQGAGRRPAGGRTFGQDQPKRPEPQLYSKLRQELTRSSMKSGTGQQWLNYLQNRGVKPDELEWTDLKDQLGTNKNAKFTANELIQSMFPYQVGKVSLAPKPGSVRGYNAITLDNFGEDPESHYREHVLFEDAEAARPKDESYNSGHWPGIPNPLAHYRTTDRTVGDGKALHIEEIQSDWHQRGAKKGYRPSERELADIAEAAARKYAALKSEIEAYWEENPLRGITPGSAAASQMNSIMNRINAERGRGAPVDAERLGITEPKIAKAVNEYLEAREARYRATTGVPDAPFKETWPNLVIKQALIDAIQQGKDYLTWTTGDDMAHVQGHDTERQIAGHRKFMDERIVNVVNKLTKAMGGKVEKLGLGNPNKARIDDLREQIKDLNNANNTAEDPDYKDELERQIDQLSTELADAQYGSRTNRTVHALKITPQMRELIGHGGLELFQTQDQANRRGSITFDGDKNTVVRLFKARDASTFMHEAGHLFLEELHKYAPHSREVAADLQEVREWLGVQPGGGLTEAQHEKFARGFELYLREGKAPSKGLASVFAKFKEWLTQIYASASKLEIEVPANIKAVFDRMLADNPASRDTGQAPSRTSATNAGAKASGAQNRSSSGGTNQSTGRSSPRGDDAGLFSKPGRMPKLDRETFSQGSLPPERDRNRAQQSNLRQSITQTQAQIERLRPVAQTNEGARSMLARAEQTLARYQSELAGLQTQARTFGQSAAPSPQEDKRSVTSVAKKAWNAIKGTAKDLSDPLSQVPNQAAYLDIRNLTSGLIYKGAQAGSKAQKLYAKLTPDEQKVVTRFFETRGANPDMVPQRVRTETVAIKNRIRELGEGLVRAGVLNRDTFEANREAYIPHLYLKHLLEHGGITGAGFKPNMSELKKRKNLSPEIQLALGKIEHPGVLANVALMRMERDLAAFGFMDQVAGNRDWSHERSFTEWNGARVTPQWLLSEAQVLDGKLAEAMGKMDPSREAEMRALADRMRRQGNEELAKQGIEDFDPKQWKQLPDRPQFGSLRGAWVRRQIADDITGMADFVNEHSWAGRWLGDKNSKVVRATQYWKMLKVPFSPAAQFRNFASNVIASNVLGEIPIHMTPKYIAQALREMRRDGPVWQEAKKYGIPQGTMAENELHDLADRLAKGLEGSTYSGPFGILKMWHALTSAARTGASKVNETYGWSESLFKTAIMAYHMDKGLPANDAARKANDAIFDYSLTHPSIKYLRNAPLGAPFLTYTTKMLPAMAKTMATKKGAMRMLPYVALAYALPAMVAGMFDLEDGDIDKLKMSLSEALRRKTNMYLMPYKDDSGRWQFMDIGYFFPWSMPQEVGAGLVNGKPNEAVKPLADLAFSNPIINAITALKTGIDPFTDRPIADKRDPLNKQLTDVLAYVWSLAMPSVLSNYGAVGKAFEKLDGTGVNRYGEPTPDWTQIGARMFGVNIYPVIPEMQRARNLQHMQSELQQTKSRMTYALKDQSLTPDQRRRVAEDYRDKIMDMTKEMAKYSRESAMTPSLARAGRP